MESYSRAGQKRKREDEEDHDSHKRRAVEPEGQAENLDPEEFKRQKQIEAGIESVRKIPQKNLMIDEAAKHLFKNADDRKQRFKINMNGQFKSRSAGALSKRFGKADQEFVNLIKNSETQVGTDDIGDIPATTKNIYSDPKYVEKQMMKKDYIINLSISQAKATRQVKAVEREVSENEEQQEQQENQEVRKLQSELKKIEKEFGKTDDEIARAFVSVSGSLSELRKLFRGEQVVQWNYLEDRALTKNKDSIQYKCILEQKGKEEVDRRIQFLISYQKE